MSRNWTPESRVSITTAGVVIEVELGAIPSSAVWITIDERELCLHWQGEDDLVASESRFYVPPDYSLERAKASFTKSLLRMDVPRNQESLGSKPLPMMIYCDGCGRHFDITVTDKGSENHRCPHCCAVQILNLGSLVKKAIEQGRKMIGKGRGGRRI